MQGAKSIINRVSYGLWIIVISQVVLLTSCVKEADEFLTDFDNNKISLVVADNFNLSSFNAALKRSGMHQMLKDEAGPFTVLAPSDQAFFNAGYASEMAVLTAPIRDISRITQYHTLDGNYALNKLPFLFNQELRSRGGRLFATHWVKGADTVLTINGSRVIAQNISATNGLIQVVDQVLTPYLHDYVGDAIAADQDLTLFYEALRSSGVLETLKSSGPFTIFAPDNAAMMANGYADIHQVLNSNLEELKTMVQYHIVRDRRFVFDYVLSTGSTNTTRQTMLDGNLVTVSLVPNPEAPGSFNSISLMGSGNTTPIELKKRDALAGNGLLHVINGMFKLYR